MRPHTYHSAMDHERVSVILISLSLFLSVDSEAAKCTFDSKNPLNVLSFRFIAAFRLGKIVAKVGLVQILRKYNFEALDNKPLEFEPHSVTLVIAGGVNLRVTKRTNST